jgi:hypothetical protein
MTRRHDRPSGCTELRRLHRRTTGSPLTSSRCSTVSVSVSLRQVTLGCLRSAARRPGRLRSEMSAILDQAIRLHGKAIAK